MPHIPIPQRQVVIFKTPATTAPLIHGVMRKQIAGLVGKICYGLFVDRDAGNIHVEQQHTTAHGSGV